ncbi:MAG: hypothetical protein EA351_08280 [Gemmatimonadales bacterium]|nr:MAG: hypothetical protein EA351_08280 [Gemmatimonadales bacterium]
MTHSNRNGFALIAVLLLVVLVTALGAAFFALTSREISNVRASADQASGFYSAEAGLNIRGEQIRSVFQGYSRPSGTSPDDAGDACAAGNTGAGDFACRDFEFNNRTISTYVVEDPRNNDPDDAERTLTIPPGERFAGLNAIQYRYSVFSEAYAPVDGRPEAILEMVFRTRLVPLFQFAAFYNKDLEILPGPNMTLAGPVHVNGDLYLNANNTLEILGEVSVSERGDGTGGDIWRGRKDNTGECTGTVRVNDGNPSTNPNPALPCPWGNFEESQLEDWGERIRIREDPLTVPPVEEFDPGGRYWQEADLVVALDLRDGLTQARAIVPQRSGSFQPNEILTAELEQCAGVAGRSYEVRSHGNGQIDGMPPLPDEADRRAVEWSNSFRDRRESGAAGNRWGWRLMLEVDVGAVMDCLHENPSLFADGGTSPQGLNDTSNGGLVWYFTVLGDFEDDPRSGYGVRLRNGAYLGSNAPGAPEINGLTVVSNHAVWIEGDYNSNDNLWRPASILSDAINILSNNYRNNWQAHEGSITGASFTNVQAAFLSGTRTTGGQDGLGGQGGNYNGGLENYPVFHENWSGQTLRYRGSFVSLEEPRYSSGNWSGSYYNAPGRDWGYDTRFNDVANLPPLSPRFVYLLQERFVRDFTR